MPVRCTEYRAAVAAELDGEQPGLTVEQRQAHAARCPECAAEARRLMALRRTLQALPEVAAPPDLAERALARCMVEPRPRRRRAVWWPVAGALAAASTAVALWVMPISGPAPKPPAALSADERYALEALGRAGARVASTRDRTQQILERVIELQELRRKRL
jgi:predicted anti-sigma-YlaC factor YlaD